MAVNPQVEFLVLLQDIDLMIRELGNEKTAKEEKKLGFELKGIETLREARDQLASKIDGDLLRRYERIIVRFPRAVVPMRDGVCFGCFVRQPAHRAVTGQVDESAIESCNHCGRILFRFRNP